MNKCNLLGMYALYIWDVLCTLCLSLLLGPGYMSCKIVSRVKEDTSAWNHHFFFFQFTKNSSLICKLSTNELLENWEAPFLPWPVQGYAKTICLSCISPQWLTKPKKSNLVHCADRVNGYFSLLSAWLCSFIDWSNHIIQASCDWSLSKVEHTW